jgi:hypothetical protein
MPGRTQARDSDLVIGETVQIIRGALAGLEGTIQGFTAGRRCILDIGRLAEGVQIVISGDSLAHAEDAAAFK